MPTLRHLVRTLALRPRDRRAGRIANPPRPWPAASDGPRVVVENEDEMWQWAATGVVEAAGYQVACCGGPHDLPNQQCPLVAEDRCPLIDDADLVINGLGISDPANRAVLTALRTRREHVPVIVEIPTPQLGELHAEIPGCWTVPIRPAPAT